MDGLFIIKRLHITINESSREIGKCLRAAAQTNNPQRFVAGANPLACLGCARSGRTAWQRHFQN
jgi:hypothetical protein